MYFQGWFAQGLLALVLMLSLSLIGPVDMVQSEDAPNVVLDMVGTPKDCSEGGYTKLVFTVKLRPIEYLQGFSLVIDYPSHYFQLVGDLLADPILTGWNCPVWDVDNNLGTIKAECSWMGPPPSFSTETNVMSFALIGINTSSVSQTIKINDESILISFPPVPEPEPIVIPMIALPQSSLVFGCRYLPIIYAGPDKVH